MVRVISVAAIVLFLSSSSYSQEEQTKNSLIKGKWALQFQIDGLINVRGFQGGLLSVKKHITDESAIRIGFGISTTISSQNSSTKYFRNDSTYDSPGYEYHEYRLNLVSQYVYYTSPMSKVNFFLGAGPQFNYSWSRHGSGTISKSNSVGAGVSGVVGVEWFASKEISFLAEYSSSGTYTWSESSQSNGFEENKNITKYFYLNPMSVRFGLSAYF